MKFFTLKKWIDFFLVWGIEIGGFGYCCVLLWFGKMKEEYWLIAFILLVLVVFGHKALKMNLGGASIEVQDDKRGRGNKNVGDGISESGKEDQKSE